MNGLRLRNDRSRARDLPWGLTLLLSLVFGASLGWSAEEKMVPKVTYDDDVKPILRQKCFACHNPDKKSGDLDLTNYTNLMTGGGSGAVIEPGDSSSSYLYMLVTHDSEPFMPPESPKLPDEMLETIRKWVDGGALENSGSQAQAPKKPKFEMGLQTAPSERPAVVPMPMRMALEPVLRTPSSTAITALATSPWGPLAAVGGQQQVLLYHTQSLELLGVLPFPEGIPQVLKFSRNGALLLAGGGVGGSSGRVVVWDVTSGQRVFEIGDELDAVLAADISSDQTLIALGGPQRVVRIFSTESGQLLHELRKHTDWITALEFSPDSVLLTTGDRNGGLLVWEAWTGRDYLTLSGHSACITSVSWRADSNLVASSSEDGSVRLWEMNNGSQVKNWGAHGGGAAWVEYARDGRIISCGRDRVVKIWDQNGAQQRAFPAFADLALRTTICNETNRVIGGDWTGAIRVWNAADGAALGELSANPPTLAERLQTAQHQLASRQAEHQPLHQALQVAATVLSGLQGQLASAQNSIQELEQKTAAANAQAAAATQTIAQAKAELEAVQQAVATLEPAVNLLAEGATKLQQAKERLPEDTEVAELAAKLQSVGQSRSSQLEANRKRVTEKTSQMATVSAELAAAQKESADATAALATTRGRAEKLTSDVKSAEEAMLKAQQAAETAAAAVAESQQQVERWQQEAEFAKQQQQAAVSPDASS